MNEQKQMKTVKQLREENNLLQKDIADLLGLSKSGYAGKESGYRKFKIPEAIEISNFFGVDISTILDFLPDDTRKAYQNKQSA